MEYPKEKTRTFKVWKYIKDYMLAHNGRPPAIRDFIRDKVDDITSTSNVILHLDKLEKAGAIYRPMDGSESRSIQIPGAFYVLPRQVLEDKTAEDYSNIIYFREEQEFLDWIKEHEYFDFGKMDDTAILSYNQNIKELAAVLGLAVFDPETIG